MFFPSDPPPAFSSGERGYGATAIENEEKERIRKSKIKHLLEHPEEQTFLAMQEMRARMSCILLFVLFFGLTPIVLNPTQAPYLGIVFFICSKVFEVAGAVFAYTVGLMAMNESFLLQLHLDDVRKLEKFERY